MDDPILGAMIRFAGAVFGCIFLLCFFCWLVDVCRRPGREKARKEALHYDPPSNWLASFASTDEIKQNGALENKSGISVGFEWNTGKEIFYNPKPGMMRPIIRFGGMGSLKTTSGSIPLALQWPHSMLILEATMETALVTAQRRLKYGPVYIVNPTGAYANSPQLRGVRNARLNFLAPYWLKPNDSRIFTRAAKIALGVIPETSSKEPYWDHTSRQLIQAIIMALVELECRG